MVVVVGRGGGIDDQMSVRSGINPKRLGTAGLEEDPAARLASQEVRVFLAGCRCRAQEFRNRICRDGPDRV